MKITKKLLNIEILGSKLSLRRNDSGVVEITALNLMDYAKGLGLVHSIDRQMQMTLVSIIGRGRLSEFFDDSDEANEIDIFMRKLSLAHEAKREYNELSGELKTFLQSYADGVNFGFKQNTRPFEFKILGFKPLPWTPEDTFITLKLMSYMGLAQGQEDIEKFIIEAVRGDVDLEKLKSLFYPYLEELNEETREKIKKSKHSSEFIPKKHIFNKMIPIVKNSNNWIMGPLKTIDGETYHCSDPHLEVNRLPAIWYETVGILPHDCLIGITMPGIPGLIMGRNKNISFSFTYGFMDMIDFFIEEVKDEKYLLDGTYLEFNKRNEIIKRKKREDLCITIFENDNGILETLNGHNLEDGLYLSKAWSGRQDSCLKSCLSLFKVQAAETTKEAMEILSHVAISCNWLITDNHHNIAYQQSGNLPHRIGNGLCPLDGTKSENTWKGLHPPSQLASSINPSTGFLCTANNNLNEKDKPLSINLPMGEYRHDRIKQLIESKDKHSLEGMKEMQSDLYSLQAEYFLKEILHLLPDCPLGRILKSWDLKYNKESKGATLFEIFYQNLFKLIFGDHFLGEDVWRYATCETMITTDFYHIFDQVFLKNHHSKLWFSKISKDEYYQMAIDKTFRENRSESLKSWGEVNKITMNHILFDGKLPKFLGFDYGPIPVEGNRATIVQGGVYRAYNRDTSFCPSWRFITSMNENSAYTVLSGGVSDRRFSKYYHNEIDMWLNFKYKKLHAPLKE